MFIPVALSFSLTAPLPHVPRSPGHISMVVMDNEPLFFGNRDGLYFPTLRLLHKCMPKPSQNLFSLFSQFRILWNCTSSKEVYSVALQRAP
jgi:hypothetical protein